MKLLKLHILSNNKELVSAFKEILSLQVKPIAENDLNYSNAEVLIVDSEMMNIDLLLTFKTTNTICFFITRLDDVNSVEEKDRDMLNFKNIHVVPPERNIEQIRKHVLSKIFNIKSTNNIFCFFGADSKVGTTGISQLAAVNLAKRHKEKSVLLLFLDGQTGFDWVEDNRNNTSCLSDLQIPLKNNQLTKIGIRESCLQILPNLLLLKGERRLDETACYHQDEISLLLDVCKDSFDFVIVDAGNSMNLDLRMTYAALINSDNNILIAEQLPKSLDMYNKAKTQVLSELKIDDFKFLVLNKYLKNNALYKKEEIVSKYGLPILTTLPYVDFYFQAAAEKNLSIFESDANFKAGIITIVKYIESKLGLRVVEKSKLNFLKLLRK